MAEDGTKIPGAEEAVSPAEAAEAAKAAEVKEVDTSVETTETGGKAPAETEAETIPSSVEDIAREKGWKPKEEFQGDPKDYVDADTFVRNQWEITASFRKSNKSMSRQLDEVLAMVRKLETSQKKVSQAQVNQAKDKLEQAREEAITSGDLDTVKQIEKDVQKLDESVKEEGTESAEEKMSPTFIAWKEDNPWYGKDRRLTRYAEIIADEFPKGTPIDEILEEIDKEVKSFRTGLEETKVEEKKKGKTPVETGGHSPGKRTRKYTINDLSEEQRAVVRRFVSKGVMTEQAYIDKLVESGELK